jgi:hypothetical protein
MKYFTKEMWLGLQDESKTSSWDKIWEKQIKAYKSNLNKITPQMSKAMKIYFIDEDYHSHGDYILGIRVKNNGRIRSGQSELDFIEAKRNTVEICLDILCPEKGLYRLSYRNVKRYFFDWPSDRPLPFNDGDGHGSLGYGEITYLGDGVFRHAMMLHSGGLLEIEFCTLLYKKLEKPETQPRSHSSRSRRGIVGE